MKKSIVLFSTMAVLFLTIAMAGQVYALQGDLNHDGKVDIKDLAIAGQAFGSFGPDGPGHKYPGMPASPKWNPEADLNDDNVVDVRDLAIIAGNFGKTG